MWCKGMHYFWIFQMNHEENPQKKKRHFTDDVRRLLFSRGISELILALLEELGDLLLHATGDGDAA